MTKFRGGATGSDAGDPLATITAGGGDPDRPAGAAHAMGLVTGSLLSIANYNGRTPAGDPAEPLSTVTAWPRGGHHAACLAFLAKYHNVSAGENCHRVGEPSDPLPTCDTQNRFAVVCPFLAKHYGGVIGHGVDRPIGTVTGIDHHGLCAAHLTKLYGTSRSGVSAADPMPTTTAAVNHVAEVRAFLVKYYGRGGQDQDCRKPVHTLTARARMGLVTVRGEEFQVVDIGLRMLEPSELLAAQFGRFASEYVLHGTKARQVSAIGNSVPPELAEAIVKANFPRKATA